MAGHEDPWIVPEPLVVTEGFHARVYEVVQQVPPGRVTTYGDVATVLGSPRVARHVGWALAALPPERSEEVPWHRVINAKGAISFRGDTWRGEEQRRRLEAEGVAFDEQGRVDLDHLRWRYDVLLRK
jgi:methylated-DNA-protein-cysteine methyltransferase-like protein